MHTSLPRAIAAALLLTLTASAVNACATATDASMTLLSEFRCENVRIELYTGASLAEARANAMAPDTPPNAVVAASDSTGANASLRACAVTGDDVEPGTLNNLGSLTLVPKTGDSRGAVVAVVERRDTAVQPFRLNKECARATNAEGLEPDDNCLRVEAQFGYVPHSRVAFTVQLTSACLSVNCGLDAVCDNGRCLQLSTEPIRPTGVNDGVLPVPTGGSGVNVPTNLPVSRTCFGGVAVGRANRMSVACPTGCIPAIGTATCTPPPAACQAPAKERCCTAAANSQAQTCCLSEVAPFDALSPPRLLQASGTGTTASGCAGALRACFAPGAAGCAAGEMCAYKDAVGFGGCRPVPFACSKGIVTVSAINANAACPLRQATCLTTSGAYTYSTRSCSVAAGKCTSGQLTACCAASPTCCLKSVSGVDMPIQGKDKCTPGTAACFADGDCAATKPANVSTWGCVMDSALGWGRCGPK